MWQEGAQAGKARWQWTLLLILLTTTSLQSTRLEAPQQPPSKLSLKRRSPCRSEATKRLKNRSHASSCGYVFDSHQSFGPPGKNGGQTNPVRWLARARGGVQPAKKKSKVKANGPAAQGNKIRYAKEASTKQKVKEWYQATPLVTRLHLTASLVLTGLGIIILDPAYFLLDPVRTITKAQIWRPFTAAAFLGPPSMSWVSNLYFLHQYGTALEKSQGTAQQLVFLLFNIGVLSVLGSLMGLPITSNALITAALHCLGRQDPLRDVNWMFSIKIKYWMLPFCLALVDMLQAQNPLAALPAALGILSGHMYYFLRQVWPKMGHRELLLAPEWLCKVLNRHNDDIIFQRRNKPLVTTGASSSEGESGVLPNLSSVLKKKSKVYKMKKTSS